jgi:hypothetical protein
VWVHLSHVRPQIVVWKRAVGVRLRRDKGHVSIISFRRAINLLPSSPSIEGACSWATAGFRPPRLPRPDPTLVAAELVLLLDPFTAGVSSFAAADPSGRSEALEADLVRFFAGTLHGMYRKSLGTSPANR